MLTNYIFASAKNCHRDTLFSQFTSAIAECRRKFQGLHLRTKFVGDMLAVEILPRNSISLLNLAVTSIHNFAVTHNMKLNPGKCKEMVINFVAIDEPGRNCNRSINIKAQHKTRRAAITQKS